MERIYLDTNVLFPMTLMDLMLSMAEDQEDCLEQLRVVGGVDEAPFDEVLLPLAISPCDNGGTVSICRRPVSACAARGVPRSGSTR